MPRCSDDGASPHHPQVWPPQVGGARCQGFDLVVTDPEGFVFPTRNGTAISVSNLRRDFKRLCERSGLSGEDWTTYELRHSFVSLVSDQLGDLTKVADLAGHADTKTTEGYRHTVRAALPHAVDAWDRLLREAG